VSQLPLAIDVADAPVPRGPGLDAETVKRLKAIGITYVGTFWSPWFKEWQHDVEVSMGRGSYRLRKIDAGIEAMLWEGEAS
jgi:hypothetical protein